MDMLLMCLLAITAGSTLSVQAGINAHLQAGWAGHPALAAMVSFAVGTLGLFAYVLIMRIPFPAFPGRTVPWHWLGGLLGAYFVSVSVYVAPRLGAVTMVALILAGQVGVSLLLDQFGWLGYPQKDISWQRMAGVLLVAGGVFLIRRF